MQYLSRRFSGFVFLFIVIAGLCFQAVLILSVYFPKFFTMQISPEEVIAIPIRLISYFVIFLPPLILIGARRYPFLKLLRVNTFSLRHFWYTIGLSVCLYLFVRMFSLLLSGLINTAFDPEHPFPYFSDNFSNIGIYIFISGFISTFFEVMTFQGIIQSGFRDLKPQRSCLYTGLLFALYMSIASLSFGSHLFALLPLTILGFVISYISFKADSMLPAILALLLYRFFSYADIGDRLYLYLLMPLGISENLAVIVLAMLSVIIGGILLIKMPTAKETRVLNIPSPIKIITKLIHSRERLRRSWLWREEDINTQQIAEEQLPDDPLPEERPVYPDDSEKQRKGAGFKVGAIIIIAAVLCDLGIMIFFVLTSI